MEGEGQAQRTHARTHTHTLSLSLSLSLSLVPSRERKGGSAQTRRGDRAAGGGSVLSPRRGEARGLLRGGPAEEGDFGDGAADEEGPDLAASDVLYLPVPAGARPPSPRRVLRGGRASSARISRARTRTNTAAVRTFRKRARIRRCMLFKSAGGLWRDRGRVPERGDVDEAQKAAKSQHGRRPSQPLNSTANTYRARSDKVSIEDSNGRGLSGVASSQLVHHTPLKSNAMRRSFKCRALRIRNRGREYDLSSGVWRNQTTDRTFAFRRSKDCCYEQGDGPQTKQFKSGTVIKYSSSLVLFDAKHVKNSTASKFQSTHFPQ